MGSGRGKPTLCSVQCCPASVLTNTCPCASPVYRFRRSFPLPSHSRICCFCNPLACQLPLLNIPELQAAKKSESKANNAQTDRILLLPEQSFMCTICIIILNTSPHELSR